MAQQARTADGGRRCWRARLLRFRHDRRGVTAVEFGLIGVPFLGLLMAIFQAGFFFYASESLASAVQDASRDYFTGSAQAAGAMTADSFKSQYLCAANGRRIPGFIDCNRLIIDVRTASGFGGIDTKADFYKTATKFCPGAPGDIVVIRVIYPLPALIPVLVGSSSQMGALHSGMVNDVPNNAGWKQLLLGVAVYQNEPYSAAAYVAPQGC